MNIGNVSLPNSQGFYENTVGNEIKTKNTASVGITKPSFNLSLLISLIKLVQQLLILIQQGAQQQETSSSHPQSEEQESAQSKPESIVTAPDQENLLDGGVKAVDPNVTEQTNTPQRVPLTAVQKSLLEGGSPFYNLTDIHVEDVDGSGGLSAGDRIVSSDPSSPAMVLTQEKLDILNDFEPPVVDLTSGQRETIARRLNLPVDSFRLHDNDLNASLSLGDVIIPLDKSLPRYELTQEDIDQLLPSERLSLSEQQRTDLSERLDRSSVNGISTFTTRFTGQVFDNDGDGQLSIGDTALLRNSQTVQGEAQPSIITEKQLSLDDFLSLSTEQGRLESELSSYETIDPTSRFSGDETRIYDRLTDALPSDIINNTGRVTGIFEPGDSPSATNVLERTGDNRISAGDTVLITRNGGDDVEHTLTQEEYERFIAGEKYIDPVFQGNTNPNLNDADLNELSGFLDEAKRYGEIRVSVQLARPADFPVAPELPSTREARDAYSEALQKAVGELQGAVLTDLGDAGLGLTDEQINSRFSSIPFLVLTVNADQLLALSNNPSIEGFSDSRRGVRGFVPGVQGVQGVAQ